MKVLLHPAALISAAVAIGGVFFSSVPALVLGAVAWLGSVAFAAAKQAQNRSPHPSDMNPESRLLLRPLKDLQEELITIVRQNSDVVTVRVVGGEAIAEANNLVERATKLVETRAHIKRTLRGKGEAQVRLRQLEAQLERSANDAERESLSGAIDATNKEIQQYSELDSALERIDIHLRDAEASMREIKTRISIGAAGDRMEAGEEGDMRELVGRLRSLGSSIQEAEEMLEQTIR